MSSVNTAQRYNDNYATLKARGIDEKVYTLTLHKMPVRKAGFEFSDIKLPQRKTNLSETELTERFSSSISRSRSVIHQLGANNNWDYFVTFTFDPKRIGIDNGITNVSDLNDVKKYILKFFNNYNQRYAPNFKYLLIPELHKSGQVHFHGLVRGVNENDLFLNENGYLDFKPYRDRFGFCSMDKVKDKNKVSSYITKYISKGMLGTVAFEPGTHLFYASNGLNRDELLISGEYHADSKELEKKSVAIFENGFCIKFVSENLYNFADAVKEFVHKFKVGINVFRISERVLFEKFLDRDMLFSNAKTFVNKVVNALEGGVITEKRAEKLLLESPFYYDAPEKYNDSIMELMNAGKLTFSFAVGVLNDDIIPEADSIKLKPLNYSQLSFAF